MLKKAVSLILLLLYSVSLVLPLVPYAEYVANHEHITTHLCEERHNPDSNCNGRCYLKKQIDHYQFDIKWVVTSSFFALFIQADTTYTYVPSLLDVLSTNFVIKMPVGYLFEVLDPPRTTQIR